MPLPPGSHLGPYEILAPIGAGGMGEVYKARDTRLDRTVAVKVLPEDIAKRDDLRARFEREARTVASLNHPNICTLFDIGSQDGAGYMVMELIDGQTLAARIEKGALPADQALKIAIQVADALDRAHRAGVTHRDIKPQNIMLTRDGAKVLDFGLAKSVTKPGPTEETLTAVLTTEGTVMGTPQYMAPEQFEGKEADARSDIWAFGAVLYEMVTGRKAFQGKSYTSLVGAILSAAPEPISVEPLMPALNHTVTACLAKEPDARWQTMADVLLQLKWIAEAGPLASAAPAAVERKQRSLALWVGLAASVLAAVALAWLHFGEGPPAPQSAVRFAIDAPADAGFISGVDTPVLSPNGERMVFTGSRADGVRALWYRPLDALEAKQMAGTESAVLPFWSPDSRSVAFYSESDRKLKRVDVDSGAVLPLCAISPNSGSGAWLADGWILYYDESKLKRVASTGGSPQAVFANDVPAPKMAQLWPRMLPDGKHILFLALGPDSAKEGIYAGDLESGKTQMVMPVRSLFEYSPAGYILFSRQQAIVAQAFDERSLTIKGSPSTVVERGGEFNSAWGPVPSVSANGMLAYSRPVNRTARLHWQSRSGARLGSIEGARLYHQLVISPDGRRAAVELTGTEKTAVPTIWLLELSTGILSLFTPNADFRYSDVVWSADGRELIYQMTAKDGKRSVVRKPAGGGAEQVIISPDVPLYPEESLPDGSLLALGQGGKKIFRIAASGGKPEEIFSTPFESDEPHVSPDGRWIAYAGNESGQWEVYVAAFPSFGNRRQVSNSGGMAPVWRADGKELFYLTQLGKLMSVNFKGGVQPETSTPAELFQSRLRADPRYNQYAVSGDGQRFLLYEPVEENDRPFHVIMNWTSLVKR